MKRGRIANSSTVCFLGMYLVSPFQLVIGMDRTANNIPQGVCPSKSFFSCGIGVAGMTSFQCRRTDVLEFAHACPQGESEVGPLP
jgi:hypothetical protein